MTLQNKAKAGFDTIIMRGGRVTKWKGRDASIADQTGSVSLLSRGALAVGLALGGALFAPSAAFAGTCVQAPPGNWVCSGPAGADTTVTATAPAATPVTVTTTSGFGINVGAGDGIRIISAAANTGISFTDVNVSSIKGAVNGIFANNAGSGAVSITTTGAVTGAVRIGLYGRSGSTGSGLTISAGGNVSGGAAGVVGFNYGAGAVSVTTSGAVTGGTLNGVWVFNRGGAAATSLVVTTRGTVTANGVAGVSGNGILSINTGSGIHTVTSYGTITATRDGIRANNGGAGYTVATGTTLTVDARNAIIAGRDGINARNYSANAVMSITTSAIATVTGNRNGIAGVNNGTKSLTISTLADVTGITSDGIAATNTNLGSTDLSISAANVKGGSSGIRAVNRGTGALSVTSTGTATGTTGYGIIARNYGTTLDVTANNATGGNDAIRTLGYGSGPSTVTVSGAIQGGSGVGINTFTYAGNLTTINVGSTAVVGSTSGQAIQNNYGDSVLNVAAGGVVNGTVRLGDGSDVANFFGANALAGITLLDGGDDASAADGMIDVLSLNGVTATLNEGFIQNWEVLAMCGGSITVGGSLSLGSALGCVSNDTITVQNTATITGAIEGAGGADTIDVLGAASVGTVHGGANGQDASALADVGDSITINTTGTVGAVYGDLGGDLLTLTGGTIGLASGGDGNDIILLQGADVTGAVTGDAGIDTFILTSGTADSVSGGDGDDTITLQGAAISGAITGDAGNETMSLTSGTAGSVSGGDGDDLIVVAGANIAGAVAGDAGDDEMSLTSGSIGAGMLGGDGDDTLEVNGGTVTGGVQGGAGKDVLGLVGGTIDFASGGDGDDAFQLAGATVTGAITGDAGNDTFALTSGTAGSVSGGDGDDIIALAGATIATTITGDAGNDLINLTSGTAGSVLGGDGDDVINWNATNLVTPLVQGGLGSDTVNINTAAAPISTGVVLDGGSGVLGVNGTDTLNLNAAWSGSLTGANTTNWEVINVGGGTVRFSDAAITAGVINVNGGGKLDGSNSLQANSSVSVSAGSFLVAGSAAGTNAMKITGNLTNAGTVQLTGLTGQQATGDVLTVTGNYAGAAGSALVFDTKLGGTNATDQLKVGGNLTGLSNVTVNNVGGTGSLTSGDGIKLVDVTGTSSGTLTLNSPNQRIDVGAFRYTLNLGGLANPADQDWYLRSRARDIVPVTQDLVRVAGTMGLSALGTLHERVGEQEHLGLEGTTSRGLAGMWGRMLGSDYSETAHSLAFGNSRSNGQYGGMEMGLDLYRGVSANGSITLVGAYGGHLWSGTDVHMVTPLAMYAGKTRSDGWIAGLYATHYAASGWYADAVVQGDWLKHKGTANDGTTLGTKSHNYLASLELGMPFEMGGSFKFEPQVQLIYGNTHIDAATDSTGILNTANVSDSLTGRAGFRLKRTWDHKPNSAGGLFTAYAKANVWSTLSGGKTTLTVGTSAPGDATYKRTWGDVGFGATFNVTDTAEFYVDNDVEFGIDQGATALSAHAGFRMRF